MSEQKMTLKEFTREAADHIRAYLPTDHADAEIAVRTTMKNNGTLQEGIFIKKPDSGISPVIYSESFYRAYLNGEDIKECVKRIAAAYVDAVAAAQETDLSYEKSRLIVNVVNKDRNLEYFSDAGIVYMDIPGTDLAAAIRMKCELMGASRDSIASFLIRDSMLDIWGITKEELYAQALENMQAAYPPQLFAMEDLIASMTVEFPETDGPALKLDTDSFMNVLTNSGKLYGASVMLYPDVLQKIAEQADRKLFILPSSIHELILVPDNGAMTAEELQRIVMEVNQNEVEPEDILSDKVYGYDPKTRELSMLTGDPQKEQFMEAEEER